MSSDRHTVLRKSAADWIQVHVQGNVFLLPCLLYSPSLFFLLDYELIRLLKAITTVFEYLGLGKPNKSSRTEPQKDSFFMSTVVLR